MPKGPPVASDQEINDFLKSRTAPATASPAEPAGPAPGHTPAPDELDFQQSMGRGMAKEGMSLAINTGRLANKGIGLISPSTRSELSQLAHKVPGFNRAERFADEPYQNWGERIGGLGLDVGSFALAPETGVAKGIMKAADWAEPTMQYVRGVGVIPTKWGKAAGAAATTAEAGTKGAIGGAVQDPEDPARGAEVGAAGGMVAPGASRFMQSGAGQRMATAVGRYGPTAAVMGALHGMGVPMHWPYALGLAALLHHNRLGPKFMRWVFDNAGRAMGYVDPLTGGVIGGEAARSMEGGGMPSWPGRPAPPSSWDQEDQEQDNAPPQVGPQGSPPPPSS